MDDIIYLIALIAWVVFAFYRKSQKKAEVARKAQQMSETRGEPVDFPTLEEILTGKDITSEPVPVPVPGPLTTDGMPPVLSQTEFEREYNLMGINSIEEMDKPMSPEKDKMSDIQEDGEIKGNMLFDDWRTRLNLREAVIYSEILNRPYI